MTRNDPDAAQRLATVRAQRERGDLKQILARYGAIDQDSSQLWDDVEFVLEITFWVDPLLIVWVVLGTVALTIAVGTATTWSALSTRPARFLREET